MWHQDIYQWLQQRLNSTRKWWRKLKKLIAWPSTFEICCRSCCCYCGCCCCCLSQTIESQKPWLNTEHCIRIPFWSIHSIFSHSWHKKKIRSRFLAKHFNEILWMVQKSGDHQVRTVVEIRSKQKNKFFYLPGRCLGKAAGFLPSNSRILVKSGNHRPLWFCFHDTDLLLDLMPGCDGSHRGVDKSYV